MSQSPFHLQNSIDAAYASRPRKLAFEAQSADAFYAWRKTLRAKIVELLGLEGRVPPSEPQVTLIESADRGKYVEEKYALDVGEGIAAPMYVLIPKTPPPYKPILAIHGHDPGIQYILGNYPNEEAERENLAVDGNWARELANAGYLVCAVEQRGMGERKSDQIHPPGNTNSCSHIAREYMLSGRTMIGERCWDNMVALTYLLNRDDVIKGGVGCSGHSGGGTVALWLSAIEDRISVIVASCAFCAFKQSILAVDHCECNYVPHILEYAEMGDMGALLAPRPFLVITGERDPDFRFQGVTEQFETVQRAYRLLGAEERCSLAPHPGAHAYHIPSSKAWFARWM
jgi:hypothetical protein